MTASLSYDGIPAEPRVYVVPGVLAIGEVTVDAGNGEVGKGVKNAMFAARLVLGLAQPGEARETRHEPARVLWLAAGCEDDPIHDLAGRFGAALAACAAEFGLDPAEALAARRYIHDLSEWPNGDPVEMPNHEGRVRAEVDDLNDLDVANRPRQLAGGTPNPAYTGPGPRVRMILIDPLDAILGPGWTIDSRQGARRTMAALNRFAKAAHAAVPVVHHMIASGTKIAGNPAVTNAVRLAFITKPDPANALVKVMSRFKSNASAPHDIRYVIAVADGYPFAAFAGEAAAAAASSETLRDRIEATGADGEPATLRDRVRAAAGARPLGAPEPAQGSAEAFRVLRMRMLAGGVLGEPEPLDADDLASVHDSRELARLAAEHDAGYPLAFHPAAKDGQEVAGLRDHAGPGLHVTYVIMPAQGS